MKKLWQKAGVAAFWLAWPALWVYLRMGKRTRVLIICGNEFLVLKGWLGSGDWMLPGGGLHRGENSLQGLIREVAEETGIELYEKDVEFLYGGRHHNKGLQFSYDCYAARLAEKPVIKLQKHEIVEYGWLPVADTASRLSDDARAILSYFQNQG